MPMIPELVFCCHNSSPVLTWKARNIRSLLPPPETRWPALAVTEPNNCDFGKLCDQTFLPVDGSHACSSPKCVAPGRTFRPISSALVPSHNCPGTSGSFSPVKPPQKFSLAGT